MVQSANCTADLYQSLSYQQEIYQTYDRRDCKSPGGYICIIHYHQKMAFIQFFVVAMVTNMAKDPIDGIHYAI